MSLKISLYQASKLSYILEIYKSTHSNICDTLHDLLPFVQFKNAKNTHGGVLLLVGYFSRFSIVQIVPNSATHHILLSLLFKSRKNGLFKREKINK